MIYIIYQKLWVTLKALKVYLKSDVLVDPIKQQFPTNAHHDDQYKLPDPSPIADPSFSWGNFDSETMIAHMNEAYDEVVHWKMNLFLVPFGLVGKSVITELARLYRAVAYSSAQESIALHWRDHLRNECFKENAIRHSNFLKKRVWFCWCFG